MGKPKPTAKPAPDAAPANATKKKRLTSWERKTQKKRAGGTEGAIPSKTAAAGAEASLNQATASAKLASADARERHRLGQTALPGDTELVDAYLAAKKAMRELHQAKLEGAVGKKKQKREDGESVSVFIA